MYITVNGVRLFYEKTGSGKPLVMCHSNRSSHRVFDSAVKKLSRHFTVYTPDSRCHGKSDRKAVISYDLMAEDMREFIKALNLEKPLFFGFSDGAVTGLILASRYPGLINCLVASGANISLSGVGRLKQLQWRFFSLFDKSGKTRLMLGGSYPTPEMLSEISVPVFLTYGSGDIIKRGHYLYIKSLIPGARLFVFNGNGHGGYIRRGSMIADFIISAAGTDESGFNETVNFSGAEGPEEIK